jgi:hypothetical protein
VITKGRGAFGLVAALIVFPWTPHYASAADFIEITRAVKLHPKAPVDVTTSSPVTGKVNVKHKFSSISSVCLRFVFEDDLLDPGDVDDVRIFSSGQDIGGFFNTTGAPQSERVFCPNPTDAITSIFGNLLDGKDDLTITMENGSVTISSLSITITGDSLRGC